MYSVDAIAVLAALLFIKHLLADGPLQSSYQVRHKGILLHPGGLWHSAQHVLFSAACFGLWLSLFPPVTDSLWAVLGGVAALLLFEFVAHYFIDYGKARIDATFMWSSAAPEGAESTYLIVRSKYFFYAFLVDQTLHYLCYLFMVQQAARIFT